MWQVRPNGAYVKGEMYYHGLYGNNRGETTAVFINDPPPRLFRVSDDKLDRNMLGLGLSGGVPITDNLSVNGGYTFRIGEQTQSHTGYINLTIAF